MMARHRAIRARKVSKPEIRKISFWSQISLLSLLCLLWKPSFAAFEDTGTGARQVALGGASVASSHDAFSLMVNPAGLASMRRQEVVAEYSRLYMGLSDGSSLSQTYMGYARPVQWGGTLAAGWRPDAMTPWHGGEYQALSRHLAADYWLTIVTRDPAPVLLTVDWQQIEAAAVAADP